jgi:hypothetical protein
MIIKRDPFFASCSPGGTLLYQMQPLPIEPWSFSKSGSPTTNMNPVYLLFTYKVFLPRAR